MFRVVHVLALISLFWTTESLLNLTNQQREKLKLPLNSIETCLLRPENRNLSILIREKVDEGAKLIHYHLTLNGKSPTFSWEKNSDMFQPMVWSRVIGRYGQGVLMLSKTVLVASMTTLNIGVEDMHINLVDSPRNCTLHMSANDFEVQIRSLLLRDFADTASNGSFKFIAENESICNMHMLLNENKLGEFYHQCCHVTENLDVKCGKLETDPMMKILLICIIITNILVVMYIPLLVPKEYYMERFGKLSYELTHNEDSVLHIKKCRKHEQKINKKSIEKDVEKNEKRSENSVKMSKLKKMKNLWQLLKCMNADVTYKVKFRRIYILVKASTLVRKGNAPVGIFEILHHSLFSNDYNKEGCFAECLKTNMLFPWKEEEGKYRWFSCFSFMARIIGFVLLLCPWIIRILVYVLYEDKETYERREFLKSHGGRPEYTGSILSLLTPVHGLFVLIYVTLGLDALSLGLFKPIRGYVKRMISGSLRNMREKGSQLKTLPRVIHVLIFPMQELGLYGCLIIPVYWVLAVPVALMILAYHFLPTINMIVTLVIDTWERLKRVKNKENGNEKICSRLNIEDFIKRMIAMLIFLLTIFSFLILSLECILFFTEFFICTAIGVISNAFFTLKYVSMAFMVILYAKGSLRGVVKKYEVFSAVIHDSILAKSAVKVKIIAKKPEIDQQNTAFAGKIGEEDLEVENGIPVCKLHKTVLFLDKYDNTYIPKAFFDEAIKSMEHCGSPGRLDLNYLKAFGQIGAIIMFLLFVIFVVMVFADEYKISGIDQMVASLAAGLIPWVLQTFFFKKSRKSKVDEKSPRFETSLDAAIKTYTQKWKIADLDVRDNTLIEMMRKRLENQLIEKKRKTHEEELEKLSGKYHQNVKYKDEAEKDKSIEMKVTPSEEENEKLLGTMPKTHAEEKAESVKKKMLKRHDEEILQCSVNKNDVRLVLGKDDFQYLKEEGIVTVTKRQPVHFLECECNEENNPKARPQSCYKYIRLEPCEIHN